MSNRERFRPVLKAEVARWSAKPIPILIAELKDEQDYVVKFETVEYQVEVQLLEDTDSYIHVMVAVDDGTFLAACNPLSESFILHKPQTKLD